MKEKEKILAAKIARAKARRFSPDALMSGLREMIHAEAKIVKSELNGDEEGVQKWREHYSINETVARDQIRNLLYPVRRR